MHPRSRRRHLLDYVLDRRRDRQYVLVAKAIRDAECWMDHSLFSSKTRLRLQPLGRPQDFNKQLTQKREEMQAADDNATMETRLCQLRNVIQSTALAILGHARSQHQDYLDDNDAEISNLRATVFT
ncbi:unnamed protein product [Schistocephalus solidus]|uniref:Uncharacterized protein n=1 Tax=Schistocephalus solidus TaxID=70667 RepID=A0A183SR92_SCHSO|nr:unnamed protein product [Schistocephalus solidus]